MQLHEFRPDPDDTSCGTCGLPRKNARHDQPAAAVPLPSATRNSVHLSPNATTNSHEAGLRAWPKSGTIKAELLDAISSVDPARGMTDKELQAELPHVSVNSLRPRRVDLKDAGWLEPVRNDLGHEVTRSGFTAWRLTAAARHQWRSDAA